MKREDPAYLCWRVRFLSGGFEMHFSNVETPIAVGGALERWVLN